MRLPDQEPVKPSPDTTKQDEVEIIEDDGECDCDEFVIEDDYEEPHDQGYEEVDQYWSPN